MDALLRRRQTAAEILRLRKPDIVAKSLVEAGRIGNAIAATAKASELFADNMSACLDQVCADLEDGIVVTRTTHDALSRHIGWERAAQGVDPAQSRAAANIFFVSTVSIVLAELEDDAELIGEVLSVVHRNVVERLMAAGISYMDYLVSDIQAAQVEERLRISREIHDRVASGVSTAYRILELCAVEGGRPATRMDAARAAFEESLAALEKLGDALFRPLDGETLQAKVDRYLQMIDGPRPAVKSNFRGDDSVVASEVAGELFLIVREAVRNSLRHADAGTVSVDVDVLDGELRCAVVDDGVGFTVDEVRSVGHTGLLSMRERVQALAGSVLVSSAPGRGTKVSIAVPLAGNP